MGLTRRPWPEEEKQYVRENAARFTAEYMGLRINRTAAAVKSKAQEMGFKIGRWSDEDAQFLRDNAAIMTAQQIADARGLELEQVRTKAKYEKIYFGPKRRNHTARQG
ncbi:hypothetical protein [Leclercia sp.]|uniref:hypothetical protein n=1 Tax=Leclercia sp. TaxID=1898428 RepID=UPI0028BE05E8|nr:hypothetical protein [Leclercia sp.]